MNPCVLGAGHVLKSATRLVVVLVERRIGEDIAVNVIPKVGKEARAVVLVVRETFKNAKTSHYNPLNTPVIILA